MRLYRRFVGFYNTIILAVQFLFARSTLLHRRLDCVVYDAMFRYTLDFGSENHQFSSFLAKIGEKATIVSIRGN